VMPPGPALLYQPNNNNSERERLRERSIQRSHTIEKTINQSDHKGPS
uniref:Uncharacterized protein n=1 Tax=Amphimedon queenslandica TaxID=400682 RepID=A0A1X7T0V9_AMPQE